MIEIIAVHVGGALPTVLEFNSDNLHFVQKQALQNLPRSPAGVPELRGLTRTDGHLPFKFKVAPDLLSPDGVATLLTQWNEKYTHAVLTAIAKRTKTERDAAKSAGLWKPGVEKGDLNAMHQECTPAEATVFTQALADAQQNLGISKKPVKGFAKRTPKPKLLDAVVDATTSLNVLTGEREQNQGAAESAVTTMRARQVIADVQAQVGRDLAASRENQVLSDPLEDARLLAPSPAQAPSMPTQAANNAAPDAEQMTKVVKAHREGRIKGPRLVEMSVADLFLHMDQPKPGVFEKELKLDAELAEVSTARGAPKLDVQPSNGLSQAPGPQYGVNVLPVELDDIDPFKGYGDHANALQTHAATNTNVIHNNSRTVGDGDIYGGSHGINDAQHTEAHDAEAENGGDAQQWAEQDHFSAPELHHDGLDQPQRVLTSPGQPDNITSPAQAPLADWSALVSFRLDNLRSDAHALVLDTGEMFEALAYLEITEPLAVEVQWLQDAFKQSDSAPVDPQALNVATDWLRAELDWRSKELMRWLGAADLVTPPSTAEGGDASLKLRTRHAKKRPPGWVAKGCELALLAQSISLDIAMLEMTARDVERALAGMPEWAVNAMQLMREFCAEEVKLMPAVGRSKPRAVFRDVWREELQRINRWCENFARIKVVRQMGLFGSCADQKLLIRLEEVIQRTRHWRNAPAPASQVLAVWLAFVLSLDHANRSDTAPPATKDLNTGAKQSAQTVSRSSDKNLPDTNLVDKRAGKRATRGSNLAAEVEVEEGQTCHA